MEALAWARLLAYTLLSTSPTPTLLPLGTTQRNVLWTTRRNWRLTRRRPLFALGYYQHLVLGDYVAAKTTFERVSEMLPGSTAAPYALGRLARREGHWDEGVSYFERAVSLDPRNVEFLITQDKLTPCFDDSRRRSGSTIGRWTFCQTIWI